MSGMTFRLRSAAISLAAYGACMASHAADCDALRNLNLEHVEVSIAANVTAGGLQLDLPGPFGAATNAALRGAPAFCRVALTARPTSDSQIQIEVWLPAENWNGRLQSVGNGAWAGSIGYTALAEAVGNGYAAASTDTGHMGNTVEFAVGHPEKLVDFAYRAVHEMTLAAKAVVRAYYAQPADYAYFVGCSTGGRQALAEAQRYPGDYDGIIAGAPAYYPTHIQGMQVWTAAIGQRAPGAALTEDDFVLANDAVIKACDTLDGVADGVIENPAACSFDAASLVCKSGAADGCLSPLKAETVALIHRGPADSSGRVLHPGLSLGSERNWRTLSGDAPLSLAAETYGTLVYGDPHWDYRTFDAERDFAVGVERIGALMDSNDSNLEPFLVRGGKLLLYHGWNDPGIPAMGTVQYYESVLTSVDADQADDGVRLFMVPGMNHCRGGVGTDRFDAVSALDRWVSRDQAPARIEAERVVEGETVRSRPLCAYPQVAVYDGTGSTDRSENFVCK
jgi:feruloyl esterase